MMISFKRMRIRKKYFISKECSLAWQTETKLHVTRSRKLLTHAYCMILCTGIIDKIEGSTLLETL